MPNINKFSTENILHVLILMREAVAFRGEALALSSANTKGRFDILPKHAHFISIIHDGVTIKKIDGSEENISFPSAVLKVKDDSVEIYIGTAKKA